jgi:hypothetical protein
MRAGEQAVPLASVCAPLRARTPNWIETPCRSIVFVQAIYAFLAINGSVTTLQASGSVAEIATGTVGLRSRRNRPDDATSSELLSENAHFATLAGGFPSRTADFDTGTVVVGVSQLTK